MDKISRMLRKQNHIRQPRDEKIVLTITSILFTLYAITLIYPLIWAVLTAFKTAKELRLNMYGFPKEWVLKNFEKALQTRIGQEAGNEGTSLIGMFVNSIWSSLLNSFCALFFSSMTAYVCTKYRFWLGKALITMAIVLQALPIVGSAPAMYDLCYKLHLINNPYLFWVVWSGGFGYYFIVLCGFYRALSMDYAEAAQIDGASHTQTYFRIMLPMTLPAIFSLFLVCFINSWNEYMTMYLYLDKFPTLSVGVYLWKTIARQNGGNTVYMAALIISVIPVIILFAAFQKRILQQSLGGGLKG